MKILKIFFLLFLAEQASAQSSASVTIIDFVKIRNGLRQEVLYYYENNWKASRETALEKKYISAYRVYSTIPDSIGDFDLMLITEFADSIQYNAREENFREIINTVSPEGPKLLNKLKPNEFRQNLFYKTAGILFESSRKEVQKK